MSDSVSFWGVAWESAFLASSPMMLWYGTMLWGLPISNFSLTTDLIPLKIKLVIQTCILFFFYKSGRLSLPPTWDLLISSENHLKILRFSGCFSSMYAKIETIQRRLAWSLHKDDMWIHEAFHIFWNPLCAVGRNKKWYSHYGKQNGDSSKVKNRNTIWSRNPISGCIAKRIQHRISKSYLHTQVHCSITHNI